VVVGIPAAEIPDRCVPRTPERIVFSGLSSRPAQESRTRVEIKTIIPNGPW
jgi:hypothetical protein